MMRGFSWILMLMALAMFMVGCGGDQRPAPTGVDEAPTTMDVEVDETEGGELEAPEEGAMDAPEEPAAEPYDSEADEPEES